MCQVPNYVLRRVFHKVSLDALVVFVVCHRERQEKPDWNTRTTEIGAGLEAAEQNASDCPTISGSHQPSATT